MTHGKFLLDVRCFRVKCYKIDIDKKNKLLFYLYIYELSKD